ncbi:MAG TPA: zonular occludens toxin domain-containing protein [Steroidobacteraceae bacterium]|nr:zonular occludens toxin domain-containing protein [Steroidobacteraceae bacterium]
MSILAYVGLPGSGKSYGVVANQILPALKEHRLVVTNLPVKVELLREEIPGCDIRVFATNELAEQPETVDALFPPGCVAIIDECWRLWPAGVKVDRIPEAYKSFLAEHRHRVDKKGRSTQIVLVTQDLAQIAAFARQLVEQTFVHKKLGELGMRGRYKVGVYEGNVTGTQPPESKRVNQVLGRYNDKVWRYYESHTMSENANGGADETPLDARGNVWRRPMLWVGLVAALAGMAYGGSWVYGFAKKPESAVGGSAVGAARDSASAKPAAVPFTSTRTALVPAEWRVTGWLLVDGEQGVAMVSNGVEALQVPFKRYCRREASLTVVCVLGTLTMRSGPGLERFLVDHPVRVADERVARQP